MSVARRTVADELAETAHAVLLGEDVHMIIERLEKAIADIVEVSKDADELAASTSSESSADAENSVAGV